ncbi:uncharacterized protein EbC_44750 [Erwinia billingiae Eb661]|uniref:Uncharacterized protein n=1 Tax=Erwinia billingiae (strain Eb661) TaxID=634500 RepID=D8MLH8_ERWBE|nr:uncharacterized protein EbC_44750 [Erwinia billingiae Eb661]
MFNNLCGEKSEDADRIKPACGLVKPEWMAMRDRHHRAMIRRRNNRVRLFDGRLLPYIQL